MKMQKQLELKSYQPAEGFIYHYQKLVKDTVLPYQYRILCDQEEGAEKSHVIANFINAGKVLQGKDPGDGFYGMVFQDSDAAKWIEAAAYTLAIFPDKELEQTVDGLIDLIAGAQDKDGYLNTRFTIREQDKRWSNLQEGHELYCAGHMMEAAVACYEATGKEKLLKVMERNAEHIYRHFLEEKAEGYPGHPEIELALMKMYRATGNVHCLELALHFLNQRGVDPMYFKKESERRGWSEWGMDGNNTLYAQNYAPVREQSDATGHSVRAVYLYTAMADAASETEDEELFAACSRLWESITMRRMYVTGGIGSTGTGEAFTTDYDLPNDTAYAETCASIGLIYFASRMLENRVDSVYADVMERALYNTVLAGMQLDGKRFFYVNPLEVLPGTSGVAVTHLHDLTQRPNWYACACCPPNVARTLASIGRYAYGNGENTGYCHLFVSGHVQFENGLRLQCLTGYPYEFRVEYQIEEGCGNLAVRLPGWSQKTELYRNGQKAEPEFIRGYAYFGNVQAGEKIEILLDDAPHFVYPSARIAETTGCVALQRGPLVYCFEGVDNEGDVLSLVVDNESEIQVHPFDEELLGGTVMLEVKGTRTSLSEQLYTMERPKETPCSIYAVPYYTWGNRGENQMRVWMTRKI
jgi:hypothetical protein